MAEKDISEKTLEAYNDVFADIVNVLLFDGEEVIKEDDLAEHFPRAAYKADGKLREIERDTAKYALHQNVRIACIGIENQTNTDPDMPIRIIGYDGADYRAQIGDNKKDRYPVITLVLYFGSERWNKARTLSECFDIPDRFRPYFNDYRINLFEIAFLSDEQVKMFKSDFGAVAEYFVQTRKNDNYKPTPKVLKHVQETLHLLGVFTKDRRFEEYTYDNSGEGDVTMSDVLTKLINEGEAKGFIEAAFDYGASDENIISKIIKKFSLSEETAKEYIQKYRPSV